MIKKRSINKKDKSKVNWWKVFHRTIDWLVVFAGMIGFAIMAGIAHW